MRIARSPAERELFAERAASSSQEVFADESGRIRDAYSRRREHSRYSLFEPAQRLAIQEREGKLLALLAPHGISAVLSSARILEIGCGSGIWLREFVRWGAQPQNMFGVDLLPERIAEAKRLCPASMNLGCQNATDLPFADVSFDLVLQSTVFTSILDSRMKRRIASEMLRVLRPTGHIIWYDFHTDNPSNPDVRGVGKQEIAELFPGCRLHFERLTLAPPLARPIARVSQLLYHTLSAVKPLCTHYLGTIRKV